jgi:hypothetical protein
MLSNEEVFTKLGYRDIGANGYYQFVKSTPVSSKQHQHKFDETYINIYNYEIVYKIWNGHTHTSRVYVPTAKEAKAAEALQTILKEIVVI